MTSVTLPAAVDDLLIRRTQESGRLDMLARYCVEAFEREGLPGVRGGKADEVGIRGLGRHKDWDLAYVLPGKPRFLVSLRSMLRKLAGAIPHRLDDLMGEAANVQQLSPELVIGYVVAVDEAEDSVRRGGGTWADHFEANLRKIAVRRAPLWNQGLIEGARMIRIDSRRPRGERLAAADQAEVDGARFLPTLRDDHYLREPTIRPKAPPP